MQYIEYNKNGKDFRYSLLFGQKLSTVKYHVELIYTAKKNAPDTGITPHSCYTKSKIGAMNKDTLAERNVATPIVNVKQCKFRNP